MVLGGDVGDAAHEGSRWYSQLVLGNQIRKILAKIGPLDNAIQAEPVKAGLHQGKILALLAAMFRRTLRKFLSQ